MAPASPAIGIQIKALLFAHITCLKVSDFQNLDCCSKLVILFITHMYRLNIGMYNSTRDILAEMNVALYWKLMILQINNILLLNG